MKINYDVTGAERKSLVGAISRELNQPTKYLGAPTFAYEIGSYRIDKNGILEGEDNPSLVAALGSLHGFKADSEEYDTQPSEAAAVPESYTYQAELSDPDYPDRMEIFSADNDEDAIRQAREFCTGEIVLLELFQTDDDCNRVRGIELKPGRLVLQMPITGFTPEKLDNLTKLVNAKAPLLKAALNAEELPIQHTNETLDFPWFQFTEDSETVNAYMALICMLCKTAIEKKRVTAKEKPLQGSSRYAFRCFLLSLGFIGNEYKSARKILLNSGGLSGNTSWKSKENADGGSEDE